MDAVAVEREAVPTSTGRSGRETAAAPAVPQRAGRSRLERLALYAMRGSMEHPQSAYPRFTMVADDRRTALEEAGFAEVEVVPCLRFGRITKGVKPSGGER